MTEGERLLAAALTGLPIGYVLARGELCSVSALGQAILFGNRRLLIGLGIAAAIVAAGTSILLQLKPPDPIPADPVLPMIAGGALFGVGMALAGGCVAGTLFRLGAGYVHFAIVLLGILGGLLIQEAASLRELLSACPGPALGLRSLYDLAPVIPPATLAGLLVLGAVSAAIVIRRRPAPIEDRRRTTVRGAPLAPPLAGAILGTLLLAQLILVSSIGFTHGIVGASELIRRAPLTHGAELVLAASVVGGASLAAWRTDSLALRLPPRTRIPAALGGGLLMGIGAAVAPGCNVGIFLGSIPGLEMHGILTGAAMVGGFAVIAAARRK